MNKFLIRMNDILEVKDLNGLPKDPTIKDVRTRFKRLSAEWHMLSDIVHKTFLAKRKIIETKELQRGLLREFGSSAAVSKEVQQREALLPNRSSGKTSGKKPKLQSQTET